MQNLPFNEVETTPFESFLFKLQAAWKIITSKNSIAVIGKEVYIAGYSKTETINKASNIVTSLSSIRHHEAVIQATVNELIAN